ncbi:16S rRNA (uracil(1498)-N(3))-methyltransferase [Fluoribacter dumoffii]|uniref:16S rRNA (uracil(1498)-N(3))-methyltransferase n=1 Tax=Fluoribacter dumoffii TaxID=463 RepID=UPI00224385B8|nr:16S rRNA (uracil(1498)-N(3))-methyltransferase [Fluoribacter dumoffii]MCW8417162.1 16S rRNA (uracil(1498)-N(3))-methyltransferase [Fluoribacter dumoffii]MCW8454998.1 16S rRNA (uracil(1498)-N(3))-methyltransferase [Fluoribacter dumoffii]MCW8460925.1 16S rRNA (uracil(1498)-N(3))-methyltransferase [Fluoribacter dumoffii]MCW8484367.1 16S rRNA (uracil(1498)-N(3))-methyltransferase [Fluoribacter dumoffii]
MRAVRIYQPGNFYTDQLVELSPEASQHVGVVLRMQAGEKITLFCGDNREFDATIEAVKKKQVTVIIGSIKEVSRESPLTIHLAQAISKGERMEFVMQKAVELGVASITPVITERCVVKLDKERLAKKLHQWQAIVIAACEQSGRNQVPMVNPPVTLDAYIRKAQEGLKLILHPGGEKNWRDYLIEASAIALLIGPEGGLSNQEVQFACEHGFQPLSLGPRILRTETAAITALSVLQAVGGDL